MNAHRLWAAVGSGMGVRLAMAALNYGLFWFLSQRLAPAGLGGFSLLMNTFLLVQFLPLLGLSVPLMRRVATDPDTLAAEVSNALAFALPAAALIALAVAADGWWAHPGELRLPFVLVAASVLPTAWSIVVEAVLLGQERMVYMARVQCLEALLRTALALAAVELGHGLTAVFGVFLAVRLFVAWVYWRHSGVPRPRLALFSRALQRRNLREVPVYLGITLLVALTARLDVVLLSHLKSLADVAVYASASRLYEATLMLPTMVALVLFPTLARWYKQQRERFGAQLALALRACLGLGLAGALATAACAQPVIDLLYRPEMHGAAAVLRWLIFGAVFMTLDQILSSSMVAAQDPAQDLAALTLGAVVLALGLLLWVPFFGATGAAAAVTSALLLRVLWRVRWAARSLPAPLLWRMRCPDSATITQYVDGRGSTHRIANEPWHGEPPVLRAGLVARNYASTQRRCVPGHAQKARATFSNQ